MRVVEYDDQLPGRGLFPEERTALGGATRQIAAGHTQRPEEPAQGLPGIQGLLGVLEAPQVHIQLAVRETVGHPVCPVHRECRLADPRHTDDRRDDRMPRRAGRGRHDTVGLRHRLIPAAEHGQTGRQLPRHLPCAARGRRLNQPPPFGLVQPQGVHQLAQRRLPRQAPAPLHVADGPHTHPGRLGQALQREQRTLPRRTQQPTERGLVVHPHPQLWPRLRPCGRRRLGRPQK